MPCSIKAISTENSPLRAMNSFVPSSGSTHQNREAGDENPAAGTVSSETIGISGTAAVRIAMIARSEARSASVTGVRSSFWITSNGSA